MKVSVILTSYNHEKYLRESINSILAQTYQDFEVIIIDDCSSDASWEIINQYDDPRIRKIRNNVNTVWIIEEVIENIQVNGEYIAIHHSDDIWLPDKLEKQVEFLDHHTEYAGVFTAAEVIDEKGDIYANTEGFYYKLFETENKTRFEWLRYFFYEGNCLCHPSVLMRKEVYYDVRPFINGMYQICDMMMWILICQKYDIFVLPEKLVRFRILNKEKNTSGMRVDSQIRSSIELFLMLQFYQNIKERDEFLKIFPEAQPYCTGEEFVPEYALAQICINIKGQDYYKLFGILLMFQLLNDDKKAGILQRQYNYNGKNFVEQIGKRDIFHVLPDKYEQTGTIYISKNTEGELILYKQFEYSYIMADYYFRYEFDIAEPVKVFRFDPCEGISVKCRIERAEINGMLMELMATNCAETVGGMEIFTGRDPIYMAQLQEAAKGHVIIEGKLTRILDSEYNSYIERDIFELKEKREENLFLNKRSNELQEENHNLQKLKYALEEENRAMEIHGRQLEQLKAELESLNAGLQSENAGLQNENAGLQNNVIELQSAVTGLQNENAERQEKINSLAAEVEKLSGELMAIRSTKAYRLYKACKSLIRKIYNKIKK